MLKYFYSVVFLVLASHASCEYFTSIARLGDLMALESKWIENFENYMEAVEASSNELTKYLDHVEGIMQNFADEPKRFNKDPLKGLKSINRIVFNWKTTENLVLNPKEAAEYAQNLMAIQNETQIPLPVEEDLLGAANGLGRLQRTYTLKTQDIANGILSNITSSSPMTANDCFHMGRNLFEGDKLDLAIEWLIESKARLKEPNNETIFPEPQEIPEYAILELLSPAFFYTGNIKMAVQLNEELLQKKPDSIYGLQNKTLFETKLREEREKVWEINYAVSVPNEEYLAFRHLYEAVCRGEERQTPAEQRNLRCRYSSKNSPFCILAPFKEEELSLDPKASYYHDTLYENEIEKILDYGVNHIERSKVGFADELPFSDGRTGQNTWLEYGEHSFLNAIRQRLNDITGLSLDSAEALQVATYGIGGHYGPHHDFSENEDEDFYGAGNRLVTALFYLTDVELGGGTAFPYLSLLVPPVRRSLLIWENLHESLELDYRTLHAGCPVLKGTKWICNEWFHVHGQEFNRPCGLQQDGNKSIELKILDSYTT